MVFSIERLSLYSQKYEEQRRDEYHGETDTEPRHELKIIRITLLIISYRTLITLLAIIRFCRVLLLVARLLRYLVAGLTMLWTATATAPPVSTLERIRRMEERSGLVMGMVMEV